MASAGQRNVFEILFDGQRWLAQFIVKEYLRYYSSASAGQRNLSKKNTYTCDITRQLALASAGQCNLSKKIISATLLISYSAGQRWPAPFIEKEYLRHYSIRQRNLSKKNLCDITHQLALPRLPAQFNVFEILVVGYYHSAGKHDRRHYTHHTIYPCTIYPLHCFKALRLTESSLTGIF